MTEVSALEGLVAEWLEGPCGLPMGTPIVVACSGGADSVALVHLLGRLRERWPLHEVLFVDHGLRPVGAEATSARLAAEREGVAWRRLQVDVCPDGNLQGQARASRYGALMAALPDGAVLATGHTMDDQAETVLQRALRGAGIRGLAGIRARDGDIIRPLLGARRAALRELKLPYSEDPTNATDYFLRNRLRHDVMPILEQENPRATEALAAVAEQAAAGQELLGAMLHRLRSVDPDLTGLDPILARTWIRWWLDGQDGAPRVSRRAIADFVDRL
ncbi:MAG: tRNA lysidine(34) synthetase TilS, partial [Myxococcota bacterium]|nr:tRNA lysidine(34) synthetase TilS [Myxococcota bacterium]